MAAREDCDSRGGVSNERSVIEKFCAITGANEDIAERLLEACSGNVDLAIGMHLDSTEDSRDSSIQEPEGEDVGDVRAPIPQKNEKLVEESNLVPTFGRRKRTTNCIFDALRDFEAEAKIQEESGGGPSGAAANKRRTLQDLFRPPIDLLHKGTFQSTRLAATQANKWLLINIQNAQEFCCQILNRDVWSNSKVKDVVRKHFIFWQGYHDSSEGQRFMQFYNINTWPYIAVLDPRTGEKMAVWHTCDADTLTELLQEFTGQYPALEGSTVEPADKLQRRRDSIMDASEESQLEAAIRLSLAESSNHTRPKLINFVSDDDDSDDDILETFSSSDSDTAHPKQLYHSIKSSSNRSSPAAAAAAGSEMAGGQSECEAGSYESEAGASNCVCVNGEGSVATPRVPSSSGSNRNTTHVQDSQCRSKTEETSGHRPGESSTGHGSGESSAGHGSGESSAGHGSGSIRVQIRFPDGVRKVLVLPKGSSLQSLTNFVEKQGYAADNYKLVTTFPTRQLSQMDSSMTFTDLGFCNQEIVYVQSTT